MILWVDLTRAILKDMRCSVAKTDMDSVCITEMHKQYKRLS